VLANRLTEGAEDDAELRSLVRNVVATETLSNTASTATPESNICSSSGMPSLSKVLRISGSTSSRLFSAGFFLGAE